MDLDGIDLSVMLIQFAVLLFSLSAHESAHAWTADYLGDYTARYQGRVSLNPLVHIDPLGTLLLPLIGYFSGWPVIGWAKPTPVNPAHLRRPQRDNMLVAAAGPLSNLLIGLTCLLVLFMVKTLWPGGGHLIREAMRSLMGIRYAGPTHPPDISTPLLMILCSGFIMNISLALFNLIPIPPLDGSKILYGMLPDRAADAFERLSAFGFLLIMVIMWTGALRFIYLPVSYLGRLIWS